MKFKEAMRKAAREYLAGVLSMAGGKVTKAAGLAGMHRAALHKLLLKHGLRWRRGTQAAPVIRTVRLLQRRPKSDSLAP